jgi:hypothetical protein
MARIAAWSSRIGPLNGASCDSRARALVRREGADQRVAQPVLGHVGEPSSRISAGRRVRAVISRSPTTSGRWSAADAGEHVEQLALAVAGHARDPTISPAQA